jgi:glycosyltransferase involved in cell wall biosynthesis
LAEILLISKPIVPPFDDSAKNIVVSQVMYGKKHRYRVLTAKNSPVPWPNATAAPIYGDAGAYSPGLSQNLKVMMYGLRPRGAAVYHYFFAPNPISSLAGRMQRLFARVKSIQTVCSQPKSFDNINKLLFADRVIVLSEQTRQLMIAAGIEEKRLSYIRPGIDFIERKSDEERMAIRERHGIPTDGPMILFPGDYEFSSAARTVAETVPLTVKSHPKATVVFACRIKRPPSLVIRDEIRAEIEKQGLADKVVFLEKVDNMPAFVGAADVVVMPAESLYAKMDVPLVLLEAASQRVPLIVANVPPLSELTQFYMGFGVPPKNPKALADAIGRVLDNPSEAKQVGNAGADAVRDIFNSQKTAQAVEQVYDEVMEQ